MKQHHNATSLPASAAPPLPLVSIKPLDGTNSPSVDQLPLQPILNSDRNIQGMQQVYAYMNSPWRQQPAVVFPKHGTS